MTVSVVIAVITMGLLSASLWSVICRVNLMKHKVTRDRVFIQHAVLAFGLCGGLIVKEPYSKLMLAAGIFLFLAIGAYRWKFGAPAGTTKPMELQ